MNLNLFFGFFILVLVSCKKKEGYTSTSKKAIVSFQFSALPKYPNFPKDNLQSPEKIALGKLLFYDPILSGNKDVACSTCHHPNHGYAEFRDLSIGVNGVGLGSHRKFNTPNTIAIVKRNAHTILNTGYNGIIDANVSSQKKSPMFWDNRTESLELQALEPIKSLEEMRGDVIPSMVILDTVIHRLKKNEIYLQLFKKAFPNEPQPSTVTLGKAIASFERSLTTANSRFDQYLNGDETAISYSEKEGFETFKRVGCAECHKGPMFSDYKRHTLGVSENPKLTFIDTANGNFKFRTPTLRNLRFTAPYMHNGTLNSLKEVLEFYEDVARSMTKNLNIPAKRTDSLILKMTLKENDFNPIISFLNCLNSEDFDKKIPQQVPSKLPVGGNIY